MANVPVLSGAGATVYLKAAGAGSDVDPFVPSHNVDALPADPLGANADAVVAAGAAGSISAKLRRVSQGLEDLKTGITLAGGAVTLGAALPAGTNNIGDMDILSLVGDNADLDSGAGTDAHAVVAIGLPGAGGHVVGGVAANPFRVDPVASTVQPVSIASIYVSANTVTSIAGVANVVASIAGQVAQYPVPRAANLMTYTTWLLQVNGSGVVAGNVIASVAERIVVVGYQLVTAGTGVLGFYDGTINAPLTGSMNTIPNWGIVVPPGIVPVMMTTSGRGLTIGLSASMNVGGQVQGYVG